MKKRLWKCAVLLFVFSMAGCQSTKRTEYSDNTVTEIPEIPETMKPTKEPEHTDSVQPTESPRIPDKEPPASEEQLDVEQEVTGEAESTGVPEATKEAVPTSVPEATSAPVVEEVTVAEIFLPDDTNRAWKDVWLDSETNTEIIWKGAPKQGKLSIKLCYPKSVAVSGREDSFELFLNGQGSNFSVRDAVEQGTLGEDWAYYEFEKEYHAGSGELDILVKTHSKEGSGKIRFAIGDITVTSDGTDKKLDLGSDNVRITFKQGNFITGEVREYDYELYRIDGKTMEKKEQKPRPTMVPDATETPDPTATPRPTQTVEGWYNLTYRLPETTIGWGDKWTESETNLIFLYSSGKKLNRGTVYVTLSVPKLSGVYRKDTFEWAVHAFDDFYNWKGNSIEIIYEGDRVIANDPLRGVQTMRDCGGYYQIKLEVEYDSSKVKDGTELQLFMKSHCENETGAYEVTLCDIEVSDDVSGTQLVDFAGKNIFVTGRMYMTGQPLEYTLSKNVLEFYIKNSIAKMPVGENYQLEVYTSGGEEVKFESSDKSVITIDAKGKMTSHKKGKCDISVTNQNTGVQKSFTVMVNEPQIVAEEYESLMITGREAWFRFTTDYTTKEGTYRYTSSDSSVVTVDDNGLVKAKKEGTVAITVKDIVNNATKTFSLEVFTPEDKDGIGQYVYMECTGNVTADIAKRSYQLLYDVYKEVFDYFNYGEYEDVTLYFTVNDYSPAYSDSRDVYLASEHMLANAKDVDCITHELIHCAQNHISVGDHVWLMEGLTDYGRYLFGRHNEDCGWTLTPYAEGRHYTDSYTVTAAFIKYVTDNYCEDMPHIINRMFKGTGGYDDSIWKENTGYTIDELWGMYAGQ